VPARVEGNPWQLLYGSDDNGFSLSTLYRQLAGIDSPVLLVIQDTEDRVSVDYYTAAELRPILLKPILAKLTFLEIAFSFDNRCIKKVAKWSQDCFPLWLPKDANLVNNLRLMTVTCHSF